MAAKIDTTLERNIAKAYRARESTTAIAARYGITRETVFNIAKRNGIARTRHEEQILRNAGRTSAQRKKLVLAANRARRSKKATDAEIIAKAITREQRGLFVGRGERLLAELLEKQGFQAISQKAVHRYNIDLAIENVAVELAFSSKTDPTTRPGEARKIEYLLQHGWHVLYIMGDRRRRHEVTHETANAVVAFIQLAERHPTTLREYRVIRCSGQLLTSRKTDCDHRP